jgi:hypothetical protein
MLMNLPHSWFQRMCPPKSPCDEVVERIGPVSPIENLFRFEEAMLKILPMIKNHRLGYPCTGLSHRKRRAVVLGLHKAHKC